MKEIFKLAIICGGPSKERGISLNSARSILDHLSSHSLTIIPIYVNTQKRFYRISPGQLYSNTPADFDFKLESHADELDFDSLKGLLKSVDLTFPIIHGMYGEDGQLQALLESLDIPFVGHSSESCKKMFPKHLANEILKSNGFDVLPQLVLSNSSKNGKESLEQFFSQWYLEKTIVKPAIGGSSIGVSAANSSLEAYNKAQELFKGGKNSEVIIEPFCIGKEFTIVVLENFQGEPVALIPTEVELSYEKNEIFNYRKKYLPTNEAAYHTPPRFAESIIDTIRKQAGSIFKIFKMRDFVRLDGWVTEQGKIYFTDINPLSGLEQNSFLFRQTSLIGLSHRQTLEYILKRSCQRNGVLGLNNASAESSISKKPVYVLFGSHNAERQVSLMTGTNVWLKLLQSSKYAPVPYLMDSKGKVWELPYSFALNHTVEEIYQNCQNARIHDAAIQMLVPMILKKLGIETSFSNKPCQMSLNSFLEKAKKNQAFVFIGLHGGKGEDGTLQRDLEFYQIPFNGSNSIVSAICMDKYLTGQKIECLKDQDIHSLAKKRIIITEINLNDSDIKQFWDKCCDELAAHRLIIKPRCDGCSAGIVVLQSSKDLKRYCTFIREKVIRIPPYSFVNQESPIEMPTQLTGEYLLEPYIETDSIEIRENQIHHIPKEGWIELTVGVLEQNGNYQSLNPSITVTEGAVLSLEEKFQGGTGINLTPPPLMILDVESIKKIKELVKKTAIALGIQNYARLDVFFNRITRKMILIEVNTLPALTPSTVIYHQGLTEEPALSPMALLDKIIAAKWT